jgi:large subunit ribosomal protein LP1
MVLTSISDLTASQKEELVASLSVLVVGSASDGDITAEAVTAVAEASGNTVNGSLAALFSSVATSAGGIEKFCAAPGAGGGGGGGGAAAGGDAAAEEEEEKEEEEEMDIGGGMDMFGGDDGGGDY